MVDRLRTDTIADELAKITREMNRDVPDATALARQAKQLKELAKHWRRSVKQTGEAFSLKPSPPILLR